MTSQQDRIEAAAWLAKLHGQDRGPELEAGFRRWLSENDGHKVAFDMANEVWGDLATIPRSEHPIQVSFKARPIAHAIRKPALAVAASMLIAVALIVWQLQSPGVTTKVGQMRELRLEDGTRATLNTDTRLAIRYDQHRRHVELLQGEVLFEIAKEATRPFSVAVAGREVRALGTSFLVRRDPNRLAITLIDGKVAVSDAPGLAPRMLVPGERLTFADHEQPSIDTPSLKRMTAWRRKQVSLDHNTLGEAVAEMNRYSRTEIRVDGSAAESILITGIFRAGDSDEFARAIADNYGLSLHRDGGKLILAQPR